MKAHIPYEGVMHNMHHSSTVFSIQVCLLFCRNSTCRQQSFTCLAWHMSKLFVLCQAIRQWKSCALLVPVCSNVLPLDCRQRLEPSEHTLGRLGPLGGLAVGPLGRPAASPGFTLLGRSSLDTLDPGRSRAKSPTFMKPKGVFLAASLAAPPTSGLPAFAPGNCMATNHS